MGLNLFVWREAAPISADEARAKLDRWTGGDGDAFEHHSSVARFHEALLRRYPSGVWTAIPAPSDQVIAASCTWLRAAEVSEAVIDLAAEHGLVCYEPASRILNPNAPGYVAGFVLTAAGVPTVPDPDAQRLDWVVRRLDGKNYFAILDRADGRYAQVGYGPQAGVPAGTWVLEYYEDGHFQTRTQDVDKAVRFLQRYRAGDGSWRAHVWQQLNIG